MSIKKQNQVCPICKRFVRCSTRYPNYVCHRCIELATDKNGNGVLFYNIEFSGHGCVGEYKKNGKPYLYNICYIKGIECRVDEAYFGGIIYQADARII